MLVLACHTTIHAPSTSAAGPHPNPVPEGRGGKTRQRGRYEMLGLNASVNAQKDATGIAAQAAQTAQAVGSDRDFAQRNSGSDPTAGTHPKMSKRSSSVSEAI